MEFVNLVKMPVFVISQIYMTKLATWASCARNWENIANYIMVTHFWKQLYGFCFENGS